MVTLFHAMKAYVRDFSIPPRRILRILIRENSEALARVLRCILINRVEKVEDNRNKVEVACENQEKDEL